MEINFLALIVSALVPTVMGFIWYHEKTFGKAWAEGAGMTEEKMKSGNIIINVVMDVMIVLENVLLIARFKTSSVDFCV